MLAGLAHLGLALHQAMASVIGAGISTSVCCWRSRTSVLVARPLLRVLAIQPWAMREMFR